jgi:transposase
LSCPGAVELEILLPHLAEVIVEGIAVAAGLVCVWARARADVAACPKCGTASSRVHSRYGRRLADAAIGGRRVMIRLTVRRFFCEALRWRQARETRSSCRYARTAAKARRHR